MRRARVEKRDGKYGDGEADFGNAGSQPEANPRSKVVHHRSDSCGGCQQPTETQKAEHVFLQIAYYSECALGPAQFNESRTAHAILPKPVLLHRLAQFEIVDYFH